ncbi:hypothetical protein JMJ55_18220 [Belnapia sp. T6]|uniref:histidine kinase n=1 Tax=Belnapia mucosa TaxID=2804532 RepID=A0ABS1V6G6_9PROT|nr:sensor histidine kinase [Belnapia mucosa]MBL6457275.1 hypothetical protein [Belnapia mucosa]
MNLPPPSTDPARSTPAGRPRSLRAHLAALVLAVLLPALAIAGAAAWRLAEGYRAASEARLEDTARAMALFLDSEVETRLAAASALASSPLLEHDDLGEFASWARAVSEAVGGWVVLNEAAPGHRQLVNTALREGAPLPPPSEPGEGAWEVLRRAVETGRPVVSDLFVGRGSGRLIAIVAAPALRNGRVTHVVALTIDPELLARRLRERGPSGSVYASLVDGKGWIVARSRDQDRFFGQSAPIWPLPREAHTQPTFRTTSFNETEVLVAAAWMRSAPGWVAAVAEPYALHQARWIRPLLGLAAGTALVLALGLAVAAGFARRILRPLQALVGRAEALAANEPAPPVPQTGVTEFETLRQATLRAEAARELLTREVDHRAKNVLAVVQAALRLTPRDDPAAYAAAIEGRIAALARTHALLAGTRWRGADLRTLAEAELALFLSGGTGTIPPATSAEIEGPAVTLSAGGAQALSMALHELATNAAKYGALSTPGGKVSLSWALDAAAGLLRLRWQERGGPVLAGPPARRGFGSRIIEATLRSQLGGAARLSWEAAGLVCVAELPLARAVA